MAQGGRIDRRKSIDEIKYWIEIRRFLIFGVNERDSDK